MNRGIKKRGALIALTVITSLVLILPSTSLYPMLPSWWGNVLPSRALTLGLDLQGGIHLVLEVQGEKAVESLLERTVSALQETMETKKAPLTSVKRAGQEILVAFESKDKEAVKKALDETYASFQVKEKDGGGLALSLSTEYIKEIISSSTTRTLETIRNRVDQFGVREPLIQQQGKNQILVQLPGVSDPERAIALIGKTALLEFKLLDEDNPVARELPARVGLGETETVIANFRGKIPETDEILFEKNVDTETGEEGKIPYLVKKQAALTGEMLQDAVVSIGDFNEPFVSITFDSAGAERFEKVTGENIRKRLAIVLDNTVYSAPVIQDKISGGRGQISGTYTLQEAKDLAIVLRAGALPAPVNIIQNVTVGPSLGRDSVQASMQAGLLGFALVVAFMVLYYRWSGAIVDVAVVLNVLLLVGALAALDATLTVPGIAGIILTIGISVDSNILIFERIREELWAGKPVRLAIDTGYDKAFSSIFDSHITTLITSFALLLFGSGPIKGFAVTLSLGVMINLFTSLVCTKIVFDFISSRRRLETLSI